MGQAVALTIFQYKGLSKVVNTGDWALSRLPGYSVLNSDFAARSPPGLRPRILK